MAESIEMAEKQELAEGPTLYKMQNALHITVVLNPPEKSEKFVFSISCFSKLAHGIHEQQLILADEEDVDITQLRILLINCQSDKLALQLDQATHKSTIQAIIILNASDEHFATASDYVNRFNFPLLFVEENCDKIIELFKYPELKAEVSLKEYKEIAHKHRIIVPPPLNKDSKEPFQHVSELLGTDSMKPRSLQENPRLFFEILKIIRIAKEDDNQKRTKKARRIYEEGLSPYLKYSEAKTDFLYYIIFIKEIFSGEAAKVTEAILPFFSAVSAQHVLPRDLKEIFKSFYTTCTSQTAIFGCDSIPKKTLEFLRSEKISFKQTKEAKDLADKLFWSNFYLLMEEQFQSSFATEHFANCYWNNFFTQKCKVQINEDSAATFRVLSEAVIMGKEMGISPERCIQPFHFILLIKKEKSLKNICFVLEKLLTVSSYSEGHMFMIKFKEFFFQWDEAKCETYLKDPEYTNNACRLMSFLAEVVYKSKEIAISEDIKKNEQLGLTWAEIYGNIVEMWASPIYNNNIPYSYPDDLLQFKIGLKINPAYGLLRKWTYSYINPTLAKIINRTKQYSPEVFYTIITKFTFLSKEFMMSYLEYYTQSKDVSLQYNIWSQIFNMAFTVSTKYEDSKRVFESVLICLHKIYKQYVYSQPARSKQMTHPGVIQFILDLFAMKIECRPIYYLDRINQTDSWKNFKISFNKFPTQIQNSLNKILAALPTRGEATILQEWFMQMILDAATPIPTEIMSSFPLVTTQKVFSATIQAIQEWFTIFELQDLTPKYLYAWIILAACCKNTSGIKHLQLHNMPMFIFFLLEIYINTKQIASTYVEEASIQTVEQEFSIVRDHLKSAAYDIQKNNVTFTVLSDYLKQQDSICKLYKMAGLGEVFTKEELEKLNTLYKQVNTKLSRKLILQLPKKTFPPCPWKLLKDALDQFGVEVENLNRIHKYFKIVQMENSEFPCCIDPMPDIKINEYGTITNTILEFLQPLEQYEEFFTHFFLQKNDLFMASLTYFCQREKVGNAPLSIESFANAVSQTYCWLENIIQEKSTFADIKPIFELLDLLVLNVDLIKSQFRKFPGFSSLTRDLNFMDMFELLQYRVHLPAIKSVCDTYLLTGCINSVEYKRINQYSEKLMNELIVNSLTIHDASTFLSDLRKCLSGASPRRLRIFDVMLSAKEFYNFLTDPENEYYKPERRKLFFDEIQIITGDLQNEDYNDKILSHLLIAYNFIIPFCFKEHNFRELMKLIASEDFKNGEESGFEQLETVNRNIQQIRLWFIRSRGEAAQNDSQQLTDILQNGTFELNINDRTLHQGVTFPISLLEASKGILLPENVPVSESLCFPILLKYGQSTKKRRQNSMVDSFSPLGSLRTQPTLIMKVMNQDMIDEFVRKLGFLEFDKNDSLREKTQKFRAFYSDIVKLYKLLTQLHYYGHPKYTMCIEIHYLTKDIQELKSEIAQYESLFYTWKQGIDNHHKTYPLLSHFTMQRVTSIIKHLTIREWDEAAQLLAFLFNRMQGLHSMLASWLSNNFTPLEGNVSSAEHLGKLLDMMKNNSELTAYVASEHVLMCESLVPPKNTEAEKPLLHNIHKYYNVSDLEIMSLLINLYIDKPFHIPHITEILHCTPSMGEEEVELFLKRTKQFPQLIYSMIKVNLLPTNLQEKIVSHMSQQNFVAQTHYIETGPSVLGELSTVKIHTYGTDSQIEDPYYQCLDYLNAQKICQVILVYGLEGVGKTHYIKEKIRRAKEKADIDVVQISIHEGFSLSSVIEKIKSKFSANNLKNENIMYFNFTIACPRSDHKDKKFQELMSSICWFFFHILILGYVYDGASGKGFYMPVGLNWQIYVEVPIQATDLENTEIRPRDPKRYLENFLNFVPILRFIGRNKLIEANKPYLIDKEVQLVCKYLRAMEEYRNRRGVRNSQIGINALYQEGSGSPIKFGNKPQVPDDECYTLLSKYMVAEVQSKKILQKLFIKYMYRRCQILETMPPFNFNTGSTVHIEVEGKTKKVCLKMLGSTLMDLMLNEVNTTFCSLISSREWSSLDHHQLVYDSVGGAYSILYLSLTPEKLPQVITQALETIGVFIPQREHLGNRDTLDPYLAKAMGIRLPGESKRLSVIDNEKYVLTSDFVLKMININERRLCGVPLIIEGETGVGKTELMRILSLLWKIPYEINLERWKSIFHEALNDKLADEDEKYVGELFSIVEKVGLSCTEFAKVDLLKDLDKLEQMVQRFFTAVIKSLEELVRLPSFYLLDFDWDEKLIGKIVNGKCTIGDSYHISIFLCRLLKAPFIQTFYKYNMHSAVTQENIKSYFDEIIENATKINIRCQKILNDGQKLVHIPTITVFIDEINTSSCLGLFKEITIDNSIDGTPLPTNLFVIAASNPHRSVSAPITNQAKERDWVLGWYHVNQIHPTMELLKWNFGALNQVQENEYISSLMAITAKKFESKQDRCYSFSKISPSDLKLLSTFIYKGQSQVRDFARDTLMNIFLKKETDSEIDKEREEKIKCETISRSKSSVSQRDIKRVFTLIEFFGSIMEIPPEMKESGIDHFRLCRRIILVAVGVVYYLRLDHQFRKIFKAAINIDSFEKFENIFEYEVDEFVSKADIPYGIAKTQGLKENLFATIVCTITKIPLIIVGPPGTSKTLSFNLTVSNLNKAKDSKCYYFQQSNFPSLDAQYYQCSRKSTSKEIENVFKRALKRQEANDEAGLPVNCVVFLDEAGLPEEQQDSLKVLHYFLDAPKVSFVAISNHILDAAKSNRAINVFRPYQNDRNDLEELAKGCFYQDENTSKVTAELIGKLKQFCNAYIKLESYLHEIERLDFFGMRDFIHFLNYLNRHSTVLSGITEMMVVRALERNFSGIDSKAFLNILTYFVPEQEETQLKYLLRNTVDVLDSSLKDKSVRPLKKGGGKLVEVRFKLIIDASEDDTVIRLLFRHNILDSRSRHFVCTDFLEDDEMQKVNLVSAIQNAASQGLTVIMSHGDDIFECFYDVFNQNYREINDAKTGVRYYANIAIGSHTKPCRIHPDFQCIIHMHKSEIASAPAPFLNRFEKFLITQEDIKNATLSAIPNSMNKLVTCAIDKIQQFLINLAPKNFYSQIQDTVNSLLIELLPPPPRDREPVVDLNQRIRLHQALSKQESTADAFNTEPYIYLDLLIDHLREKYNFQIIHMSIAERITIAIDILEYALTQVPDATKEYYLIKSDPSSIIRWIPHAIELLYTVEDPDADFIDDDKRVFNAKIFVNYGERLVGSMLLQFIIRYVCCQLLKVTIPETITINKNFIDPAYRKHYLYYQNHFSLKKLIASHIQLLEEVHWDLKLRPTKLICFTTTNSFLHKLPDIFPTEHTSFTDPNEKNTLNDIKSCIFAHADRVCLFSLRYFPTQEHFIQELKNFLDSDKLTVMVLIVNVQLVSTRKINFVRHMIEQEERLSKKSSKFFVLILHYSPGIFHSQGFNSDNHSSTTSRYPSHFVLGWDHYYIDSISPPGNIVDIQAWLKLTIDSDDEDVTWKHEFVQQLKESLMKDILLDITSFISFKAKKIDSRLTINSDSPSITRRIIYLRKILKFTDIGFILCEKFVHYWTPKAIQERLVIASSAVISRDSNLNISDYVQTNIRYLFSQYIIEMIYRINDDLNLDTLFDERDQISNDLDEDNQYDVDSPTIKSSFERQFTQFEEDNNLVTPDINKKNCQLFERILINYNNVPSIEDLQLVNRNKDMAVSTPCWSRDFPFSKHISQMMEDMIEMSLAEIASIALDTPRGGTVDRKQEGDVPLQDRVRHNFISKMKKIEATGMYNEVKYPIIVIALEAFDDNEAWNCYKTDFILSRLELHEDMGRFIAEFARLWGQKFNLEGQTVIERVTSFHVENYFNPPDSSRQLYLVLNLQKTIDVDLNITIESAHADFSAYIVSTFHKLLATCGENIQKWKEWTLNYECLSSQKNINVEHLNPTCKSLFLKLNFLYLNNCCDRVNWSFVPNAIALFNEYKNDPQSDSSDLPSFMAYIQKFMGETAEKTVIHEFLSRFLDHYIDACSPLTGADCDYLSQFILNVFDSSSEFYHVLSFQRLEHLLVQLLNSQPPDLDDSDQSLLPFNTSLKQRIGSSILYGPQLQHESIGQTLTPSFSSYFPPNKKISTPPPQTTQSLDTFIPPYYYNPKNYFIEQAHKNVASHMRSNMAHLYFSVCMNDIERLMQGRELEHMMRQHELFSVERNLLDLEVIAQIEKQALFQVILKKYASFYDISKSLLNPRGLEQYQQNFPDVIKAFYKELMNVDSGGGIKGGHSWVMLSWIYLSYSSSDMCTEFLKELFSQPIHEWLIDFEPKMNNYLSQSNTLSWTTGSYTIISKILKDIQSKSQTVSTKISENPSINKLNDLRNFLVKESAHSRQQVIITLWYAVFIQFYCEKKTFPLDEEITRAFPNLCLSKQKFIRYFANPTSCPQIPNSQFIRQFLTEQSYLQKSILYFIEYFLTMPDDSCFYQNLIFEPQSMVYMPGCLTLKKIGEDPTAKLDLICCLNEEGLYSSDAFLLNLNTKRNSFSLQSFYFINMLNYISILLSYLTQHILLNPEVQAKLFSARYCRNLVMNLIEDIRKYWKLLVEVSGVYEEDMVCAIKHFFTKTLTGSDSETIIQLVDTKDLSKFELNIHYRFHKISLTQVKHDSRRNPDLAHNLWTLNTRIPKPITARSILAYIEPKNSDHLNNHDVILAFISLRKPLRVGAMLLPIALKLYEMFHVNLNYVLLKDMAKNKTLTDFVKEVSSRQQNLIELKDLVRDFEIFLPEYIALRKPNLEIDELPRSLLMYHVLNVEEKSRDAENPSISILLTVIKDIIKLHNGLIDLASKCMSKNMGSSTETAPSILPTQDSAISNMITDLTQSELVQFKHNSLASCRGDPPQTLTEEKLEVSKFYRRRAPDSFIVIKEIQGGFNLDGLERDIIMTYISPKFKFDDPPEKEYHFRIASPIALAASQYYKINVFNDLLSEPFKTPLPENLIRDLEYHFHMLDYNKMLILLKGLQTVTSFLIQSQNITPGDRDWADFTLGMYAKHIMNQETLESAFSSFEFNKLSKSQSTILADFRIVYLFECFKFFYDKLNLKYYEFCHLSYSVKRPLPHKVERHLELAVQHCLDNRMGRVEDIEPLRIFLDDLQVKLQYKESYIIQNPKSSMEDILKLVHAHDITHKRLINLLNQEITNEHYVHLILKIKSIVSQLKAKHPKLQKWEENVVNFWDLHLPYFCENNEDESIDLSGNILYHYNLDFFDTDFSYYELLEQLELPHTRHPSGLSKDSQNVYDIIPKEAKMYL